MNNETLDLFNKFLSERPRTLNPSILKNVKKKIKERGRERLERNKMQIIISFYNVANLSSGSFVAITISDSELGIECLGVTRMPLKFYSLHWCISGSVEM